MKPKTTNQKLKAFTLIELLIVLVVLSILGLIGAELFSSVLKGTNKAAVITEVKQNGQFISDTLERHIRQATNVSISADSQTISLSTLKGQEIISFSPPCGTCNPKTNGKVTLNNASIANTDPVTGVDVTTATFTLLPVVENSPKVVQVDITLNQGISAGTRQEFTANVRLVNTYSLRTY